jgi:hypothetical protein
MYVCIMRQCFSVDTSYGSWLGLILSAWGWDVIPVFVINPNLAPILEF